MKTGLEKRVVHERRQQSIVQCGHFTDKEKGEFFRCFLVQRLQMFWNLFHPNKTSIAVHYEKIRFLMTYTDILLHIAQGFLTIFVSFTSCRIKK